VGLRDTVTLQLALVATLCWLVDWVWRNPSARSLAQSKRLCALNFPANDSPVHRTGAPVDHQDQGVRRAKVRHPHPGQDAQTHQGVLSSAKQARQHWTRES
jgi:hypothetical protein